MNKIANRQVICETLMEQVPEYAKLFAEQKGGREHEA